MIAAIFVEHKSVCRQVTSVIVVVAVGVWLLFESCDSEDGTYQHCCTLNLARMHLL